MRYALKDTRSGMILGWNYPTRAQAADHLRYVDPAVLPYVVIVVHN